jgi:hypothetical protein
MRKHLFIIPALAILATLLNGCLISEGMRALQANTEAIDMSTYAIMENAEAIEQANCRIEENRRQIEMVNRRLEEMNKS